MQLVWRHPLAAVAGRAVAMPGAFFTAICLITGSIWGRPNWGTWWEGDGDMTCKLVLFFRYMGYIAPAHARARPGHRRRRPLGRENTRWGRRVTRWGSIDGAP